MEFFILLILSIQVFLYIKLDRKKWSKGKYLVLVGIIASYYFIFPTFFSSLQKEDCVMACCGMATFAFFTLGSISTLITHLLYFLMVKIKGIKLRQP